MKQKVVQQVHHKERATMAQIFRLQEWFSIPGELLEKLTCKGAARFISRVYQSGFSWAAMDTFKQELLSMIKKREPEAF